MSNYYTSTEMAKMKNGNIKYEQGWETIGMFIHCLEGKIGNHFGQLEVSDKVNFYLPYGPAIALLGIHPRTMKIYVYTKTYP